MSPYVSLRSVSKSYGLRPLFSGVSLGVGRGERIGLIGANGSGKSTLLKILAGITQPDDGERTIRKLAKLAYLAQEDSFAPGLGVEEIVAESLLGEGLPESEVFTRVGVALGKAGFVNLNQRADDLSGGWRKRLALARELIKEPDVLLMDEPTNHLDLESILWLEKLLPSLRASFVVVSHDRYFLENVTNRTIELGLAYPDGILSANGPYSAFLEKREEFLASQAGYEEALAGKVRREIEWLRRGPKARTTKAKYRIDAAGKMIQDLAETKRRNAGVGLAKIDFTGTDRQTKRLIVAEGIAKSLGGRKLFDDLDIVLSPGVRLGLLGLNGSGKTTLLRTLSGDLAPDAGAVRRAPNLKEVTFDQNREQLDKDKTLRASLASHGDSVVYRDRCLHVASWAKRFLFTPDQFELPVGLLSGGEQARILIAQLMLRPADVLFLDEPTNNLDIPTLEILEESLMDFPGAVVLISHDRHLLDRVSTVVLGLDGQGGAEVFADYAQWDAQRLVQEKTKNQSQAQAEAPKPKPAAPKPVAKKLTYKEQREFEGMELAIQEAEELLETCQAALVDPAIASDANALHQRSEALEQAQAEVDRLYARWEELEAKAAALEG